MTSQDLLRCPRCGHDNLPGSKFCAQCGNSLEITCPVCSTPNPITSRFCSNCGNALTTDRAGAATDDLHRYVPDELMAKIRAARSGHAMQGERRTVTMLFADIQGSTAAAEGLDPEEWAEIMNGAFEHLIAPVYRYEGTLARLLGDAVLAFFGAPIAHEDDPVRAVRAGLEIVEAMQGYKEEVANRWSVPIDVRVGINTGLVVVGEVGSDLRVEYSAIGDAINVAARMEQTADPGTIRVTGVTWDLVADHFEAEEIGPVEVKGKSDQVPVFRVIRHVVRAPIAEEHRLVGRSQELGVLEELLDRLVQGTGWIASITGEAGVGKSRLLEEFHLHTKEATSVAYSHDEPGDISWMTAASRSYDSSIPYSTIGDLLQRWWGLEAADEALERVEGIVAAVGVEGAPEQAVYLTNVAGLALPESAAAVLSQLDPPALNGRAREAVFSYLEAEVARRPVVVVLEDLHWADSMSLALVDDLMRLADRYPLGLVFSMRPYRDEPTWHTHEVAERDHPHRYRNIDLSALPAEAARELLDELLEDLAVSDETRKRILERSDGNPLFVEQMARALREGHAETEVPTGLTTLLTARLDRLHEESKLVAQMAAVIGSEFDREILASLLADAPEIDERLNDLLRRGIFAERQGATGTVLTFHHALMREAAYSTVLLRTRKDLHRMVAQHLISAAHDSPQEIARHFVEAGDMEGAFPHLVAAGERTSRSMALSDAIRFFTTALDNIPANADPDLVVRAHDGLGFAYTLVPDLTQSAAAYQRLLDYGQASATPSAQVTALNRLALTTATLGRDLPAAKRYLEDARRLAEEAEDQMGLAEYHMNSCFIATLGGEMDVAAGHDEQIASFGQALGVDSIRMEGMVRRAANLTALMDFERAVPAVEDALEGAKELGAEHALAIIQALPMSRLRLREGDIDGALRLILDSEDVLGRYASFYGPLAEYQAGKLLYMRGDVEEAISRLAEARRRAPTVGAAAGTLIAGTSGMLARAYASLGIVEPIAELRAAAIEALGMPLGDFIASSVWADLGLANLSLARHDEAGDDFRTGLAVSSTSRFWERPLLLAGSALVHVALDELGDAHRDLDEAQSFVLEKEVRFFDADLGHARGEALLAEGKPTEASKRFAEALIAAEAMGLRPLSVQIRASAARAAAAEGALESAASHVSAARTVVGEMASSIVDPELRSALETAWLSPLEEIGVEG